MGQMLKKLLIVIFITLLFILLAEVLARTLLWEGEETRINTEVEFGYSASGLGDLRPNMDRVEQLMHIRPYFLQTNSAGLRNMEEIDENEDVFRVLVIGDSFTYGLYVHNQETYPARLEEYLNANLRTEVQVLNAGVPGYTISDELDYLKDKGLALAPDLVVLGIYTNDIFDLYPPVRELFGRDVVLQTTQPLMAVDEEPQWVAFLRENVALYTLLRNLRQQYQDSQVENAVNRVTPIIEGLEERYRDLTFNNPDSPEYAYEWAEYERLLAEMALLLEEQDIPFAMILFPDLAQLPDRGGLSTHPQTVLAELAADRDIPFLDMLPIYREYGDIQSLYLMHYNKKAEVDPNAPDAAVAPYMGDGHPSPHGHLLAARTLADMLIANGLVPD
jgi:lysophospholipase L1-like esterase